MRSKAFGGTVEVQVFQVFVFVRYLLATLREWLNSDLLQYSFEYSAMPSWALGTVVARTLRMREVGSSILPVSMGPEECGFFWSRTRNRCNAELYALEYSLGCKISAGSPRCSGLHLHVQPYETCWLSSIPEVSASLEVVT